MLRVWWKRIGCLSPLIVACIVYSVLINCTAYNRVAVVAIALAIVFVGYAILALILAKDLKRTVDLG